MFNNLFYGLLDLPLWAYITYLLVFTHITILGVTIFLHRNQAHRALDLHPILSHFFRFWVWIGTGMVTKEWAAIHRKHHAKCETIDDPHSPQVFGIRTVFWQGVELYRRESKNKETTERYGKGTPDDWLERNVYSKYTTLGMMILLGLELLCLGVPGLAIWGIQMLWIPFFAAGVVNGIGHYWGYRNFECPDASRNISPIGCFIGGEELHNNHHTYPTSAKFSVKPWEFDLAWGYIRVFEMLGLAKVKRVAPKPHCIEGKTQVDSQTLYDVLNNRFQVMARYSKDVIMPIFKQEIKAVQPKDMTIWRKIKTALLKEASLVDINARQKLSQVLAENSALRQVVQYREKLQSIWNETTASQKELLTALQNWCQEAEASGLKVLQDFSNYLKSYALQPG